MGDAAFMLQVKVWPLRVRAAGGTMFQCSTLCQTKGASPPHFSFSSFHSLVLSRHADTRRGLRATERLGCTLDAASSAPRQGQQRAALTGPRVVHPNDAPRRLLHRQRGLPWLVDVLRRDICTRRPRVRATSSCKLAEWGRGPRPPAAPRTGGPGSLHTRWRASRKEQHASSTRVPGRGCALQGETHLSGRAGSGGCTCPTCRTSVRR